MTSDMSKRNEQIDGAVAKTIRPRSDLSYLARTSPPIPDSAMQEAHKLIEADKEMRSSELEDEDPSASASSLVFPGTARELPKRAAEDLSTAGKPGSPRSRT